MRGAGCPWGAPRVQSSSRPGWGCGQHETHRIDGNCKTHAWNAKHTVVSSSACNGEDEQLRGKVPQTAEPSASCTYRREGGRQLPTRVGAPPAWVGYSCTPQRCSTVTTFAAGQAQQDEGASAILTIHEVSSPSDARSGVSVSTCVYANEAATTVQQHTTAVASASTPKLHSALHSSGSGCAEEVDSARRGGLTG